MKIRITMKDPDTLGDAVRDAARDSVRALGLAADEEDAVVERRIEHALKVCARWFEYGEYLRVDIDTDAGTIAVVPVRES